MISRSDLNQEVGSSRWWARIGNDVEVFFETNGVEPDESVLEMANFALANLRELEKQSIDYIDVWVDRTREGVGTEYELRSLFVNPDASKGGQTRVDLHFVEDEGSVWWVLFGNPVKPYPGGRPKYWPVSFGREQQ